MLPAHLILAAGVALWAGQGLAQAPAAPKAPEGVKRLLEARERTYRGDPRGAQARDDLFDYLGIRPEDGSLYVFVSTSMPKPLVQAYLAEAAWSGAVLVVRGIPDGWTLHQWVQEYATPLVDFKGATTSLTIDPPLFDLYGVTTVPQIVWDESDRWIGEQCDTARKSVPGEKGKPVEIQTCAPYPANTFYSLRGAVSVDYALDAFTSAGARRSAVRRDALRRFHGERGPEQVEFQGDWDSYLTPDMQRAKAMGESAQRKREALDASFFAPYFERDYRQLSGDGYAPGVGPGSAP